MFFEKIHAAENQPHVWITELLLGFLVDDHSVNLGDLLILGSDLDFELVLAILQGQVFRQFHGGFRVEGGGSDLDFLDILVGVGVQLVLGLILVEALDGGAAVDPQGYQICIVAEMIAAEAVVVGSVLGIHMGLHADLAAAGALQPVILGVAVVAKLMLVGIMNNRCILSSSLFLISQELIEVVGDIGSAFAKLITGLITNPLISFGNDDLIVGGIECSKCGHGNQRTDQHQSQQQRNELFHFRILLNNYSSENPFKQARL